MRRDPAVLLLATGQTLAWASIFYVFPALLLRWEQALGWSRADLTAAIAGAILVSAAASPIAGRFIRTGFNDCTLGKYSVGSLTGGRVRR